MTHDTSTIGNAQLCGTHCNYEKSDIFALCGKAWHQQKTPGESLIKEKENSAIDCGQLYACPKLNEPHALAYHTYHRRMETSLEALRALICFRGIDLDPISSTSFSGPYASATVQHVSSFSSRG